MQGDHGKRRKDPRPLRKRSKAAQSETVTAGYRWDWLRYGVWARKPLTDVVWCQIPGFPKGSYYEIDLARAQTSAQKCDWLAQIAEKSWATQEILGALVQMLDATVGLRPGVGDR